MPSFTQASRTHLLVTDCVCLKGVTLQDEFELQHSTSALQDNNLILCYGYLVV